MRLIFAALLAAALPALSARAQTNTLSDAEIQGRRLALEYLRQTPPGNSTNTGKLVIRDRDGKTWRIPVAFATTLTATNWLNSYRTLTNGESSELTIAHDGTNENQYLLVTGYRSDGEWQMRLQRTISGNGTMVPFAGSDFWVCDLGLEFFHWPDQKILKHEMRRGRACRVLQSTNPDRSPDAYSKVVSWIDNETGGIVHAEAYDVHGKLLKEFDPKSFKKIHGQWTLEEMEIRNDQTDSRTKMEFDLPKD